MRYLVGVAFLIGALLLPSAAHAQSQNDCYCVWFLNQYARADTNYYRAHVASVMAHNPIYDAPRKYRDATRAAIYAQMDEDKGKSFCSKKDKLRQKACKAAAGCVIAAVASITRDLKTNADKKDEDKLSASTIATNAGTYCAQAAVIVFVVA